MPDPRAMAFWGWLNLRGRAYRVVMRFAHRHGWHYAPKKPEPWPPTYPPEAGASLCWCQWCGLRGHVLNPTGPLKVRVATSCEGGP